MEKKSILLLLVVVFVLGGSAFAQTGIGNSNSNQGQDQAQGQEQGQSQGQESNSNAESSSVSGANQDQAQGQDQAQTQNNEGIGTSRVDADVSGSVTNTVGNEVSNTVGNDVENTVENEVSNETNFNYSQSSYSKYTERTGVVTAGHPNPPWAYPFNPKFWNDINADPAAYQRWWVPSETVNALKKIRNKGFLGLGGKGFKWEETLDDYNKRPRNKPRNIFMMTDARSVDMNILLRNYQDIGVIVVTGDVRRHFDQVARKAVDLCFPFDIDAVYLTGALNPVNLGTTTSGPGLGGATAGQNYSLSLIGGALSSESKVKGEAYVSLRCLRRIPVNQRGNFAKYRVPADIAVAFVADDGGNDNGNVAPRKSGTPIPPVLERLSGDEAMLPGPALSDSGVIEERDDAGITEEEDRPVASAVALIPVAILR